MICIECKTDKTPERFRRNRKTCKRCLSKSAYLKYRRRREQDGEVLQPYKPWTSRQAKDGFKLCLRCSRTKRVGLFGLLSRNVDGFSRHCIACQRAVSGKRYSRNEYYIRKYGIDEKTVEDMRQQQQSICPICKKMKPLIVDHCHKRNVLRGLLCRECNIGLGNFKDSPEFLEAAAIYLRGHSPSE